LENVICLNPAYTPFRRTSTIISLPDGRQELKDFQDSNNVKKSIKCLIAIVFQQRRIEMAAK
jgi:hypothetical protein